MSRFTGVEEIGFAPSRLVVSELGPAGIKTPKGFTVTADAYQEFLRATSIRPFIAGELRRYRHGADPLAVGAAIRTAFAYAEMPSALGRAISAAYQQLGGEGTPVVVRSAETTFVEDHEIFLNVRTGRELFAACKRCFAVLFTDRAISLREQNGVDHLSATISVGVQRMVRSDLAGSGSAELLDGHIPGLVRVSAVWGLGDTLIGERVEPDEYLVLDARSERPLITTRRGSKAMKVVCAEPRGIKAIRTEPAERQRLVLTDDEVVALARHTLTMSSRYGGRPLMIEWAKDGTTGDLYSLRHSRS